MPRRAVPRRALPAAHCSGTHRSDVVGPLKGFRQDKIPLSEIVSRVGGQRAFDAAVLETILLKAMGDVRAQRGARAGAQRPCVAAGRAEPDAAAATSGM